MMKPTMNYEDNLSGYNGVRCPFCGHVLVTDEMATNMAGSRWSGEPCEHTLFVASESPAFSDFEYRSRRFNAYLDVPDDSDLQILIPSDDDANEAMPIHEVVERIDLPDHVWLSCCDGFFIVYIGFLPRASTNRKTE